MGRGRSSVECRLALGFLSTCPVCFSILFCLVLSCPVLLCVCPPDHDQTTVLVVTRCARCVSLSNCFCCVVLFYHISVCLCLSVCLSSARASSCMFARTDRDSSERRGTTNRPPGAMRVRLALVCSSATSTQLWTKSGCVCQLPFSFMSRVYRTCTDLQWSGHPW